MIKTGDKLPVTGMDGVDAGEALVTDVLSDDEGTVIWVRLPPGVGSYVVTLTDIVAGRFEMRIDDSD